MRRLWVFWLAGCGTQAEVAAPSYAVDVAPLLERHCTRCHTSAGRRDGGVELDTYASARSTRVSSACTALDASVSAEHALALRSLDADPTEAACSRWASASMPPGAIDHLTLHEQHLLARWVATGATP